MRETDIAPTSLIVDSGAGVVTFDDHVGSVDALNSLNVVGDVRVNADVTTRGPQTWTDTITIGGNGTRPLTAGSLSPDQLVGRFRDIALLTDSLNLGGEVSSTGDTLIAPATAGTDIGVGTANASFTIDNAELTQLHDGFSQITIGYDASGDLVGGGITTLTDDMLLRAGSSSDLVVDDALSWATNNTLTLAAGRNILVNDDIDVA